MQHTHPGCSTDERFKDPSLEEPCEPQVNAQYELMRTLLPAGHVSPQAKWKEATVVFSERLICQSQHPLISGSTLTAAEPFSITEHWKKERKKNQPTDPQSRPPPPPRLHTA